MLSDVTFGQYYPAVSPVHKMNPAIKILLLVAYIVAIFLIKNFYGLALMVVATLFITFVSKIPLKSVLKSIKGILFIIILTFIINVFLRIDNLFAYSTKFLHYFHVFLLTFAP